MAKKNSFVVSLLKSNNKSQILEGIELFKKDGKPEELTEVFLLMRSSTYEEIIRSAYLMISEVKDQSAVRVIVQTILDKNFSSIQKLLVAACWQTGLDFSEHLGVFTDIVRESDLETGIEALTVAENFAEKATLENIETEIELTRKYIKNDAGSSNILSGELLKVLEQMRRDKS